MMDQLPKKIIATSINDLEGLHQAILQHAMVHIHHHKLYE